MAIDRQRPGQFIHKASAIHGESPTYGEGHSSQHILYFCLARAACAAANSFAFFGST